MIGTTLALEGVFAFFAESVFLGIFLAGRQRVSARIHYISAIFVFLSPSGRLASAASLLFSLNSSSWRIGISCALLEGLKPIHSWMPSRCSRSARSSTTACRPWRAT